MHHLCPVISIEHGCARIEYSIRQARRMCHEMANGDGRLGWFNIVNSCCPFFQDLTRTKLGNVDLDRVVPLNTTLVEQYQNRTRSHQLGAGEHSENVIFPEWNCGFPVGKSTAECIDNITTSKQSSGDAWQELLVHLRLHCRMQCIEISIFHSVPATAR